MGHRQLLTTILLLDCHCREFLGGRIFPNLEFGMQEDQYCILRFLTPLNIVHSRRRYNQLALRQRDIRDVISAWPAELNERSTDCPCAMLSSAFCYRFLLRGIREPVECTSRTPAKGFSICKADTVAIHFCVVARDRLLCINFLLQRRVKFA